VRHLVPRDRPPRTRHEAEVGGALSKDEGRFDGRNVVFHIFARPCVIASAFGAVLSTATTQSWST